MIEVRELDNDEINALLERVHYGHFACCRNARPYVVPVHYAWDGHSIFVYTTEGKKTDTIAENPNVCLQVEDVTDTRHWTSVVVDGTAELIGPGEERESALKLIMKSNPTLTPAVSVHWMDNWVKQNVEVIYKITPEFTSGRAAVPSSDQPPISRTLNTNQ